MKRFVTLFFIYIIAISAYCQSEFQEGDLVFRSGDYSKAISLYEKIHKQSAGETKIIADIRLIKAQNCLKNLSLANSFFSKKQYNDALAAYEIVIESNTADSFVKSQIDKCKNAINQKSLRKATAEEIADVWNNKYGVDPERKKRLIAAGIDPVDVQWRINRGEGKPVASTFNNSTSSLWVSKTSVSVKAKGENIIFDVQTNGNSYSVAYLPSWAKILYHQDSWFSISVDANHSNVTRTDWFKVLSSGKEVKIDIIQDRFSSSVNTSKHQNQKVVGTEMVKSKSLQCFNCPKTINTSGLTFGYIRPTTSYEVVHGFQVGLKAEPLYKYGFGLNTGLNLEWYVEELDDYYYDESYELTNWAINIPLHLEYRFNFSRWFNVFFYGGAGVNVLASRDLDSWAWPATLEYGGGIRIEDFQFRLGKRDCIGDLKDLGGIGRNRMPYDDYAFSLDIFL